MFNGIPKPSSVSGSSRPRRSIRVAYVTNATCVPLIHTNAAGGLRGSFDIR